MKRYFEYILSIKACGFYLGRLAIAVQGMSNCLSARDPVLAVIRDSCHKHTSGGRSWCVAFEEEPDSSHRWTSALSAPWQLLCLNPVFWNCMAIICNYSMVHCQIWYLKKVIYYLNLPIIAKDVFKGSIGCSLNKKGQSLKLESRTVDFSMVHSPDKRAEQWSWCFLTFVFKKR